MKAFANYHPGVLMVYFLSVTLTALLLHHPVMQLSALLGGILFCGMLQGRRAMGGNLAFYLPLFCMIAVVNPMFSHNGVTPLFFLNGNPVTLEAVVYGVAIAVMLVAVMFWCKCYSEIMTSDKFLYLFGALIPRLSLFLSMLLRFLPAFKKQMRRVSRAQKGMGLYASKSYVDKLRGGVRVFSVMVTWSAEHTAETAASMKARGYGLKGRTNYSLFRMTMRDGVLLALTVLLLAAALAGRFFALTDFYYYPEITTLNTTAGALWIYWCYLVLTVLPFCIETKENLKWNYYRSKI